MGTREPSEPGAAGPTAVANHRPVIGHLLCNVAFWQGMMFLMLVCLIWVNQVLDLPSLFYQVPASQVDWVGAGLVSAGIIVVGFITVAHTFVLQRRILKGVIIVCSYCNKAKVEATGWQNLEHYLSGKTMAVFSHGVCPACFSRVKTQIETESCTRQTRKQPPLAAASPSAAEAVVGEETAA